MVSISVCFQAPRTAPANSVCGVVEVRASFDLRVVGLLSQFGLCLDSLEWDLSELETEKQRESSERVRDKEMFRKSEGVNRMRGKKEMT